tara:strand:- start:1804 stop:2724 length:921 start_codon:yes stop_codon:yes gene_type:complete
MMSNLHSILMVRPSSFRTNTQTLQNNHFQKISDSSDEIILQKTLIEFDNLVNKIRSYGIPVTVFQDDLIFDTPDSIFPNNWISFHTEKKIVLYPMYAENRRLERNENIIKKVESTGVIIDTILDYTKAELNNQFLEGTGSMVLDRKNKKAYASISERTSEILLDEFCDEFNYMPIVFESYQNHGNRSYLIYHTNVMMCVADKYSVICLESIKSEDEKKKVKQSLIDDGKEIIEISSKQLDCFSGNMIELIYNKKSYLVMSETAFKSLSENQLSSINNYSEIIYSNVDTIESCGGGSVRCMIAEVFN